MITRRCLSCQRELPIDNFRFNGAGYNKSCKECQRNKDKKYFVSAGHEYGEESDYRRLLKRAYPDTYLNIIIRIERGEY